MEEGFEKDRVQIKWIGKDQGKFRRSWAKLSFGMFRVKIGGRIDQGWMIWYKGGNRIDLSKD